MNPKQLGVGLIVGTIVALVVGYIIFDNLVSDFYAANMGTATGVMRDSQLIWAVVVGTAAYTALIIYTLMNRSGKLTIADGLKNGAIVGFLLWGTVDFVFLGVTNMNSLTIAIVDPLLELIRGGITGAAIAAVAAKL